MQEKKNKKIRLSKWRGKKFKNKCKCNYNESKKLLVRMRESNVINNGTILI